MKFSSYEIMWAATLGVRRFIESARWKRSDTEGKTEHNWNWCINGALAELAVAKELGIPWQATINTFDRPDVGRYQVRWTSTSELRIDHRKEPGIYILVTGDHVDMQLRGYITTQEAMKVTEPSVKRAGRKEMLWVKISDLHPIDELPEKRKKPEG